MQVECYRQKNKRIVETTTNMKVYIGSDHNGYYSRKTIRDYLIKAGYEVCDEGDDQLDPQDDFPVFAQKVVHQMKASDDKNPMGILICGSGQGMCMAANRFQGIRAALGYSRESVRAVRNDDNANVLCLPATELDGNELNVLVETFLSTPFAEAPRFKRRLAQLDDLPH